MFVRLVAIFLVVLTAAPMLWAESDVPGSRDPLGIERFPRSWIVDYRREDEVRTREFVVGRVERVRRDARVQEQLRFDATLESAIYRIPDGTPVAEVAAHFRSIMEGGLLYRCSGRDCGRSNEWANQIFGKAILYGPDGNQQYLAWEWQGRLIAIYIIERGNKRIYANVQVLDLVDGSAIGANQLFARRLTGQGWSVIDGIAPAADGSLPDDAEQVFAALAGQLDGTLDAELYLVCHFYGARPAGELVAASERCASAGAALLSAAVPRLRVQPFGAGPFLPRGSTPVARLELVVPRLLSGAPVPATGAAPVPGAGG